MTKDKNEGMKLALDNANSNIKNWGDMAYDFFIEYAKNNGEFLTEDVRAASEGIIPIPPNLKAWGAIATKAVRKNEVYRVRYGVVKNQKAHNSICSVWAKIII